MICIGELELLFTDLVVLDLLSSQPSYPANGPENFATVNEITNSDWHSNSSVENIF